SATGKTSLIMRYTTGLWHENYLMTLGVDSHVKNLKVKDIEVNLVILDTGGQECFRLVSPIFYNGVKAAAVVFDITRRESFKTLDW
ncbi:MAG: Rab family GTPase, partial [Candidatus Heimdallarchaeaceae archaeon]